jgi:hypothetical protein
MNNDYDMKGGRRMLAAFAQKTSRRTNMKNGGKGEGKGEGKGRSMSWG